VLCVSACGAAVTVRVVHQAEAGEANIDVAALQRAVRDLSALWQQSDEALASTIPQPLDASNACVRGVQHVTEPPGARTVAAAVPTATSESKATTTDASTTASPTTTVSTTPSSSHAAATQSDHAAAADAAAGKSRARPKKDAQPATADASPTASGVLQTLLGVVAHTHVELQEDNHGTGEGVRVRVCGVTLHGRSAHCTVGDTAARRGTHCSGRGAVERDMCDRVADTRISA
jgi:hypothetical protein